MNKLKIQKDKVPLNKITHTLRTSQAVLQYGVGAMIDFPDQTLMSAAPEYWSDQISIIHDERLEKVLNVDYFGVPGGKDEFKKGISYVRFPQWYFCPKCRRFQPLDKWYREYQTKVSSKQLNKDPYMKRPRCLECKLELVAARIVVACEKGHIDDFPWVKWVHQRNFGKSKPVCSNPSLTFETGSTASAGLEGLIIKCKSCNAKASLKDAFDPDIFKKLDGKLSKENSSKISDDFKCTGNHPWNHTKTECETYPRAMQRGASSIYFPKTASSLVIPPYSDNINKLIEESKEYKKIQSLLSELDEDDDIENFILKRIDRWARNIAVQKSLNPEPVKRILERKLIKVESDNTNSVDRIKFRSEEYLALTGEILSSNLSSRDFIREEMKKTDYDIYGIKQIALVHKIREVRALIGFSRLNPPSDDNYSMDVSGLVSIKRPETRWYPAYEVRGEGIFIEFNHELIKDWIKKNKIISQRSETLQKAYKQSYLGKNSNRTISPKLILLHTIAHLLIKQLSFECGYSIASLRERIYCSEKDEGKEMSGILIYTANGDSEGTLGGLVRQGYPDSLPRIFKSALQNVLICSNDPVCITSKGQGRESLNLAACHTCTFLPETSCEEFNIFLDRAFVIGTFESPEIGFYRNWIDKIINKI